VPLSTGLDRKLWLDGYNGERCVVFDEFRGQVPIDAVKILCDHYGAQAPFKGGFVPWLCDVICFTSQLHPDQWWAEDAISAADRAAFAARCVIIQFDEVQEGPEHRLAASRSALGADFAQSLPAHSREVRSIWLSAPPAVGRSVNLQVPDLSGAGGLPSGGLPIRPLPPVTLEDRLRLLQPEYPGHVTRTS
jgi:hypothetical protein